MVAALDRIERLQLADTFGATTARNHDAKPLLGPMRQTHVSQLGNPSGKMGVRKFVREQWRETLALGGEQNWRQHHTVQECHANGPGTSQTICSNESLR